MLLALIFQILILPQSASGKAFIISPGLTSDKLKTVSEVLGYATATKQTNALQAFGNNSPVEIQFNLESISTTNIAESLEYDQYKSQLLLPKFTIGKGLTSKTDVLISFTPFAKNLGLSGYGGMLRYQIYKRSKQFFMSHLSIHGNTTNFNNQATSQNLGFDWSFGLANESWSLSTVFGLIYSSTTFIGGSSGVTASGSAENYKSNRPHTGLLIHYSFRKLRFAIGIDHYRELTGQFKVGFSL